MDFEFVDPGILRGNDFELFRFSIMAPDTSRGIVPAYDFRIRINNQIVGQVNLRVGLTEHIMLYAGNLGYKVDPPYRGRHLAVRAINLLLPVARHHQMSELWICCNPENWASRKTCERVGAELVEIIEVPRAMIFTSVEIEPIAVTDCGSNFLASHGHARALTRFLMKNLDSTH